MFKLQLQGLVISNQNQYNFDSRQTQTFK